MSLSKFFPSYINGDESWGQRPSWAPDRSASDQATLARGHLRKGLVILADDGRWRSAQVLLEQYVADLAGWQLWLPRELLAAGLGAGLRCEALPDEQTGAFIEGLARAGEIGVILDFRLQSSESKVAWAQAWPGIHEAACLHVRDLSVAAKLLLQLIDLQAADRIRYGRISGSNRPGSSCIQAFRSLFA